MNKSMTDINSDFYSATDVGLVRKVNEDSCGVAETPNGVLCVLCDGMGGHVGGAEASGIAVSSIVQYFGKAKYADMPAALKEALDFANLQILGTASEKPELQGMGTTACILLVQDDKAWIAHIGDSRIYLYVAAEHRLHRLTKDHSFVQGLVDQGFIYEEEAEKHPDKNRILKALGLKENISPDIPVKPVLPARGDIFLVCSDGLSGMIPDSGIEKILAGKTEMKDRETALMSAAKAAGGTDNITFQMVYISHSPHRKSVFKSKSAVPYSRSKSEDAGKSWYIPVALPLLAIACIMIGVWIGRITVPTATDGVDLSEVYKQQSDRYKIENSIVLDSLEKIIENVFSEGPDQDPHDKQLKEELARKLRKKMMEHVKHEEDTPPNETLSNDTIREVSKQSTGQPG
jgi:serine/threonine protein phosphatase PrpC